MPGPQPNGTPPNTTVLPLQEREEHANGSLNGNGAKAHTNGNGNGHHANGASATHSGGNGHARVVERVVREANGNGHHSNGKNGHNGTHVVPRPVLVETVVEADPAIERLQFEVRELKLALTSATKSSRRHIGFIYWCLLLMCMGLVGLAIIINAQ